MHLTNANDLTCVVLSVVTVSSVPTEEDAVAVAGYVVLVAAVALAHAPLLQSPPDRQFVLQQILPQSI